MQLQAEDEAADHWMLLNCRYCKQELTVSEVSGDCLRGYCAPCDRLFRFPAELAEHVRFPCPKGIAVVRDGACPRLEWRWWTWPKLYLIFLCVCWNAVVLALTWSIWNCNGQLFLVWCLPHGWVALALIYASLAFLFNQTTIGLTPERLVVQQGPIPWSSNLVLRLQGIRLGSRLAATPIDTREIVQVNCESLFLGVNRRYAYFLTVLLTHGRTVYLLRVDDPRNGLFIKQQIDAWLGLTPGERSEGRRGADAPRSPAAD